MKYKNIFLYLSIFLLSTSFLIQIKKVNLNDQDSNEDTKSKIVLSDITVGSYTVPGVSGSIPTSQILKIGILGDMNDITGDHAWKGAILAAREINKAGEVSIDGDQYYIGLVAEDTDEANPNLDIPKGVAAALKMVDVHDPHFIIGGYRTESIMAYQEVIMNAQIPFICTGCPTDHLCQNVISDYSHYKYFFRVMPINTTSLVKELSSYLNFLAINLSEKYGGELTKFAILREDLAWTDSLANALTAVLPSLNPSYTIIQDIAFDITATSQDISAYLAELDATEAQIVIPLISGQRGIYVGQQYGLLKPKYLLTGINTLAQSDKYWDQTTGHSQYEITMQYVYNTSKTSLTIPFWNNFFEENGVEPYYTGIGSYDAVRLLVDAAVEAQSFESNTIVSTLENNDINNPFTGASWNIAFTMSHDLVEGMSYSNALFCQWQMDGNKEILPSNNTIYPNSIATGTISIPYWGINDLVGDNSHNLPGNFTLTSQADDPDKDGSFDLSWTDSVKADRYSIYYSGIPITYISKRYTTRIDNNAISPYSISGLKTGEYYFVVVAYNDIGFTISNNVKINIVSGFWILTPLVIDDSGQGDYTWEEVVTQPWCSGSGIESDPYVIEFIEINGQRASSCLVIRNSSVFFNISNCVFSNSSGGIDDAGLKLEHVSNGNVFNSTTNYNTFNGIYLFSSHNNSIRGNFIGYNQIGTYFNKSNYNSIINNIFMKNNKKWVLEDSQGNLFIGNKIITESDYLIIVLVSIIVGIISIASISTTIILRKRIFIPKHGKEIKVYGKKKVKIENKLQECLSFVDHLIKERKIKEAIKKLKEVKDLSKRYSLVDITAACEKSINYCNNLYLEMISKIKKTVLDLGTKFHRLEIADISDKSGIEDEELIISVFQDMIQQKEIFGDYFASSKAIAFEQQRNIDQIDELIQTYNKWKEINIGKGVSRLAREDLDVPEIETISKLKPDELKEFNIFLSYSTRDSEYFDMPRIVRRLEDYPDIDRVLFWEADSKQNIVEFMDETLQKCNVFVLFCSEHSVKSAAVKDEWQAAFQRRKKELLKLIPVYIKEEHIPPILGHLLNVKFDKEDFNAFIEKLHQEIQR